MKKQLIFILWVSFLVAGCGGTSTNQETSADTVSADSTAETKTPDPAAENSNTISIMTSTDEGAELIVKNDCRNCHKEREKLIGPAFSEIAKRYGHYDIDPLAAKIIKGGSGHWGDASMSPHPSLSMTDARVIVRFILKYK
jgi:cytochrome c